MTKKQITIKESDLKQIIKKEIQKITETTRRQKAVKALNGEMSNISTIAILTSENPFYQTTTDGKNETNQQRRENLEKDLNLGHFAWFPVKGVYYGKENSYLIYNISLKDALWLGKKFGQQSIIFMDGGHYEYWEQTGDGKYKKTHVRSFKDRLDMSDADNLFTQVCRKFKFQIPFFDGSDENNETLDESMSFINNLLNKRFANKEELRERINISINSDSGSNRYNNRCALYGDSFSRIH